MRFGFGTKAAVIALSLVAAIYPQNSHAQTATLGGDDDEIFRVLRSSGYTKPVVTQRGLTIIRTEACKGTDKYQVKVSILGRITSERKIGTCPVATRPVRFTNRDATRFLRQEGYKDIKAKGAGALVVATACQNNRKFEIKFSRRGKITSKENIGSCKPEGLSIIEITRILQERGYRGIVVTDHVLPRYRAEACKNGERHRIDMNGQGVVSSERRIGECRQSVDAARLPKFLEDQGYSRVEIVQRQRPPFIVRACKDRARLELSIDRSGRVQKENRIGPCQTPIEAADLDRLVAEAGFDRIRVLQGKAAPYLVEACKGGALVEVTVGRFGRIVNEERVGRCASTLTRGSLTQKLVEQGYLSVEVRRSGSGWTADVCRDRFKHSLVINLSGETIRDRRAGECASNSAINILQTLERRGANSVELLVEGCFQGNKYRWAYDRLGNRTGRREIGKC